MFGFLNVYKPAGMTSHDVVAVLRRVTKIKQIGHTGTLDPFAEGVLPICIGKATRLIEYLNDDKAYIGTVQLGQATTTYDKEGEVVHISDKIVTEEEIENALKNFRGSIEQMPPIYSAIKVKGKKLYEYARNGEKADIKPRNVTINENKILYYNMDDRLLKLYISSSKGTYIRSIANDLGVILGTYGHLVNLVRVKAGKFLIDESHKLENLDTVEKVNAHLINPLEYLDYARYELSDTEKEQVSNGMNIKADIQDGTVILIYKGEIKSVANSESGNIKMLKVFN